MTNTNNLSWIPASLAVIIVRCDTGASSRLTISGSAEVRMDTPTPTRDYQWIVRWVIDPNECSTTTTRRKAVGT
jgi:hypothetical protein